MSAGLVCRIDSLVVTQDDEVRYSSLARSVFLIEVERRVGVIHVLDSPNCVIELRSRARDTLLGCSLAQRQGVHVRDSAGSILRRRPASPIAVENVARRRASTPPRRRACGAATADRVRQLEVRRLVRLCPDVR